MPAISSSCLLSLQVAALPPPGDQGALGQQRSQLLKESRDVSMQVRLVLIRKCQGDMF